MLKYQLLLILCIVRKDCKRSFYSYNEIYQVKIHVHVVIFPCVEPLIVQSLDL